jgi:hypothetical protein
MRCAREEAGVANPDTQTAVLGASATVLSIQLELENRS